MSVELFKYNGLVAGVDEAGRGPLAGPVFAAAVVLPDDFDHPLLDDSKKLSEKKRLILQRYILDKAIDWAVAMVDNVEIDRINILNASIKAMHLALTVLSVHPQMIIVDGNRFKPFKNIPYKTIVKGDARYAQIAAASILAKNFRDEYMRKIARKFPQYGWHTNKGYPTAMHKQAVMKFGLSPYHRRTFCQFYYQKNLFEDKS